MGKTSNRSVLEGLVAVVAVVLVSGIRLMAQDRLVNPLFPNSTEIVSLSKPAEIASNSTFPSAPEPERLSASAIPMGAEMAFVPVVAVKVPPKETEEHRFWDRENRILFVAAGGLATADFFVTHANLASGGKELNPVTRVFSGSTAGLATNFALEGAGVIGVSYFLHKTGHHKLERISSLVNIGGSAGAVAYSASHR